MTDKQKEFQILLEKYHQKTIGKEEKELLRQFLNEEDPGFFDPVLSKNWDLSLSGKDENDPISFAELQKVLSIESSGIKANRAWAITSTVLRYAAVILITAGLTWILSKSFENKAVQAEITYNTYTVPLGSKSILQLSDGTRVWLNSGTTLRYPSAFNQDKREVQMEGEAFFEVKHDPKKPFFVNASEVQIKVFGTRFNVKSFPNEKTIETTLVSGSVSVRKKTGNEGIQPVMIRPNQVARYSRNTGKFDILETSAAKPGKAKNAITHQLASIEPKQIESIDQLTAWKDNRLVFRRENIENLTLKLERWYGVKIVLQNQELKNYSFTGTFENETIEQALHALKLAYPFHYSVQKNIVTIK